MISDERKFRAYALFRRVSARYRDFAGSLKWVDFVDFFYSLYDVDYYFQCRFEKNRLATIARRARVIKYLRLMADSNLLYAPQYLLSLTFTDDVLSSTNFDTRLKYVRSYLNDTFSDYFACVDFGKSKGREHYHAIVNPSSYDYEVSYIDKRGRYYYKPRDKLDWKYGFFSLRPIYNDAIRSASYAFKASNYAFKCSSSEHKPFHKRGASHFLPLDNDDFEEGL